MASPYIRHVHSKAEMDTLLSEGSVVVVSFYTSWSAPCRKIAPVYSRLAAKHRNLTFVKVEISEDNIHSVAQKCRLITLPTFIIVKGENEVGRIQGVDQKGLEDMIAKHAPEATPTAGDLELDAIATGDESLMEYLDMCKVNCLNESQNHPLKSIVEKKTQNTTEAYLESDADEQLLITLPFNREVKVRCIILYAKEWKFGPKKIKIDINKPALGFDDVESAVEPAIIQVLEVPEEVVKGGRPIQLRFVRMQRVNSLHIFVESNHGNEDVTRIDAIDVYGPGYGEPTATTQTTGLRDFWGTRQRGLEFLKLFQRKGGLHNLSNAIALLRESIILCPADHKERALFLGSLANAIVDRYEREGSLSDLEEGVKMHREALNLCPPGNPHRASSLHNLVVTLRSRYKRKGSLSDLEEAIELSREALDLCPTGHPDHAIYLTTLANCLRTRYSRAGGLSDLKEAIEMQRKALNLRPPGHPDRAVYLNNLANALRSRYDREGGLADLGESVVLQRDAFNFCFPGHPNRALSLANLASTLLTRYERMGSPADLEEGIKMQQEALNLRPFGHPHRATSLNDLALTLVIRYKREGDLSDLEKAIEMSREALSLCPTGHPGRAGSFTNLVTGLLTRYEREESLSDLEEAIEMQRDALNLCPPGHLDRALSLNNLASGLSIRYRRKRGLSDLEEAIEIQREALNLRPPGHPDRAMSLNNLANTLLDRYEHDGSLLDLEEVIKMYREVLKLRPLGHPEHALSLHNLANALFSRYTREGRFSDLEEATKKWEKALDLRLPGHPGRSISILCLCQSYLLTTSRKDVNSTVHDHLVLVNKVSAMLREAVNHSNSPPLHRLKAALLWIDASLSLAPRSVLEAFSASLDQLDIVLATSSTLASKHTRLSSKELVRCQQLGAGAASYAVRQGDTALAVEFLERGRNLLFAQVGRYRVELEELQKESPELVKRFSDLSGLLDSSVVSNQPTLEARTAFEDPTARYRRVASDWDQVVNDIRAVPGFESFLRPPHYTTLQAAAAEGPVITVIPDDNQSHALIILLGRKTPHYVSLPEASGEKLGTLCLDFVQAVESDDIDDADSRMITVLRRLWVLVVGPIADALENKLGCPLGSRIWWCPSSLLSLLPLHAAGRYTSNADPNQNFPARYVSSYTPTLRTLGRARSKCSVSKGESILIIAQPDTPGQSRLPNTIPEAEVVKALAEAKFKMKPTLLCSKEGTRAAVLSRMADHPWIHLACHGSQNLVNPFDSCFCLYDKELTLHDIIQRGLPDAKFAFLAACHTSTGDTTMLDEGLHLAAGLQLAGFQSVVGTIWEVADIDGPAIAKAFYMALQSEGAGEEGVDCRGAALALSKAVKHLRDQGTPISRWIRHIHIGI